MHIVQEWRRSSLVLVLQNSVRWRILRMLLTDSSSLPSCDLVSLSSIWGIDLLGKPDIITLKFRDGGMFLLSEIGTVRCNVSKFCTSPSHIDQFSEVPTFIACICWFTHHKTYVNWVRHLTVESVERVLRTGMSQTKQYFRRSLHTPSVILNKTGRYKCVYTLVVKTEEREIIFVPYAFHLFPRC